MELFFRADVKAAWVKKWTIFGDYSAQSCLNMEQNSDKSAKPVPTPFAFSIDSSSLVNRVKNNQASAISRLKFQLQQFLKMPKMLFQ